MNNISLLRANIGKIVRFNKLTEKSECNPSTGMRGYLRKVTGPDEHEVCEAIIDCAPFADDNDRFDERNFYDSNSKPCLSWRESPYWNGGQETIYFEEKEIPFDLVEPTAVVELSKEELGLIVASLATLSIQPAKDLLTKLKKHLDSLPPTC